MRGHGLSAKPSGPYSIPLFAQDVAALIRVLDIAPAHILGLSMGGMVAFQLAIEFPHLVKSLIIVNSAPEIRPTTFSFSQRLQLLHRQVILHFFGMRKMGEFLATLIFPLPEQAELRQVFIEHWAENDLKAYHASLKAIVNWSVADEISTLNLPVLVVAGDKDFIPLSLKKTYAARIPHSRLAVISDSRHATPVDQCQAFNTLIQEFLLSIDPN